MTFKKYAAAVALTGALALCTVPALAATTTSQNNLTVSATVQQSCTVAAGTLAFGTSSTASATITVNCDYENDNTVDIAIGAGGAGTAAATRTMAHQGTGTKTLDYTLSNNSTEIPVDGAGTSFTVTSSDSGRTYTLPISGSLTRTGTNEVGTYQDTVVVTVTYEQDSF